MNEGTRGGKSRFQSWLVPLPDVRTETSDLNLSESPSLSTDGDAGFLCPPLKPRVLEAPLCCMLFSSPRSAGRSCAASEKQLHLSDHASSPATGTNERNFTGWW